MDLKLTDDILNTMTKAQLILHIKQLYTTLEEIKPERARTRINMQGVDKHYADYYKDQIRIQKQEVNKDE